MCERRARVAARGWMSRMLIVTFALAAVVSSRVFADERNTAVIDQPAYASAQRLVDIDHGRRLNLYCIGEGTPTVVFDAGLANWSQIWGLVQPAVAKRTRACAYDRAGLGFSDPATRPGTSANIADDLHRLLHAASIAPPYLLVGHSYGGMNVRLYADYYRDEVAGLVLDDPSHEDYRLTWLTQYPEPGAAKALLDERAQAERDAKICIDGAKAGFVPGTELYLRCVSTGINVRYSPAINVVYFRLQQEPSFLQARLWEDAAFDLDSPEQLRMARRSYGDLPLIVLTRAMSDGADGAPIDGAGWLHLGMHEDLASLSTRGVQRTIPHSSHDIHMDQPQAVIDAILEVLAATRAAESGTRRAD